LALAAVCVALLGDRSRAPALRALLAPRRGQLVVVASGTSCEGAVDRYLGSLAAIEEDLDGAEAHFAAALALEEAAGGPALAVRTRIAHGRAVRPSDPARATALLDAAEAAATELGLAGALAEVAGARAGGEGPAP